MILARVFMQTVVLALGQIRANKFRSLLTALGIIIGVASVTAVIGSMTGLKQYVLTEFETFGAKKVFIDGRVPESWEGKVSWRDVQLTREEVEAISNLCPSIELITPMWHASNEVRTAEKTLGQLSTWGIMPEWHEIEDRFVTYGRPFSSIDDEERRQVCLINDQAIEDLNLDRDPVGDFLFVDDRRFMIVGVVETKDLGAMFGGGDNRTEVFIPFGAAQKLNPFGWINYAIAQLKSPDESEEARAQVEFVLRKTRGIKPDEENTFEIHFVQQFIDQFNSMAAVLTTIAGGIVAISLLVGGIGIMNIMLVSVSERTREIGLRKAVGARPSIILLQFLVEAVTLCLVGGLIGLMIGQGFMLIAQSMPDSGLAKAEIPPWAIALAFLFSAGVGVVFGMFPAIKAARLDPIEALRHE